MTEQRGLSKWIKTVQNKVLPRKDPGNLSQDPPGIDQTNGSGQFNNAELYGLFEFPPRTNQSETAPPPPLPHAQCVDIIAVHGLGGSWQTTWSAGRGDNPTIWLRDRLPEVLARINVRPRIRAFGYDAKYIFTSSTSNPESCAEDLLTRIRIARQTEEERQAPIIFVAHSLGGLIVKLAMNIAHTDDEYHHDVLDKTAGCLFLAVPFHGADVASWAQLGSKVVSVVSVGMTGNQGFTSALTKNSKDWMKISRDFVQRGRNMTFRSAYETEKMGGSRIVDEASVRNNVPNERVFPMPGSNHRNICKFSDHENGRFAPVGLAVTEIVQAALDDQGLKHLIISELPISTPKFYGRCTQLGKISSALSPTKLGRKGVVLFGIGGSGKTQLALHYAKMNKQQYKAIIWINAFTSEQITQSFTEAFHLISKSWPAKDVPNPYQGKNERDFVLARLRSTLHRNWLLVIDSADDLENKNLVRLVPESTHGSIIVTSTRRGASDILEHHDFLGIEIDKLDDSSGKRLLLDRTGISDTSQGFDNVMPIVKELNGLPLALEQAGILLRRRVVNLDNFIEVYRRHYNELMEHPAKVGEVQHDKTRSIHTIFGMLYECVKIESRPAAAILRLLAVIGPAQIPLSILQDISQFNSPFLNIDPEFKSLRDSSKAECRFRRHLNLLEDVCLVKSTVASAKSPESIILHRAICQWLTEIPDENKDQWIIFTALGLGNVLCRGEGNLDWPMGSFISDSHISRACLAWVDHISSLINKTINSTDLQPPTGRYAHQHASITQYFGYIYFCNARFKEAKTFLSSALEHIIFQHSSQNSILDSSLQLYYCLGVSHFKIGELSLAEDNLKIALEEFPEKTSSEIDIIRRRLEGVSKRDHINQQHYAMAVAATRGPKSSFNTPQDSRRDLDTTPTRLEAREILGDAINVTTEDDYQDWVKSGSPTNCLLWAASTGRETLTRQLFQTFPNTTEINETLLGIVFYEQEAMIDILIKHGADIHGTDAWECTVLHYACYTRRIRAVELLLNHGADIEAKNDQG
ncbi:hypothetical protein F4781DRAFT_404907 [Annulohypoxylon bovei var. microspora]|nr:hypothetical protein F4781DRAFT_404907 [Annulohypoxylon bovei var. microspora]